LRDSLGTGSGGGVRSPLERVRSSSSIVGQQARMRLLPSGRQVTLHKAAHQSPEVSLYQALYSGRQAYLQPQMSLIYKGLPAADVSESPHLRLTCLSRLISARLISARLISARLISARLISARLISARLISARLISARLSLLVRAT
jgi:hypothetical protein